ncbi:hypothetical protein QJV45_02655 [Listeria booriae]|uniref:hypothetical protein n=1 Tax=Listeria booriae TaxID=1552123 RepID=UPI0028807BAE|nr:hypothetical protein [Listeria booriae]MDT0109343.1 hypothetical protein [Listeria booriae]
MYRDQINVDRECEKALGAFLQAYSKEFADIEKSWNELVVNCRNGEFKETLQNLVSTGQYTAKNLKTEMVEKINRFMYIYFKNKPSEFQTDIKEVCASFVKAGVFRKLDKVFK